MGQHQGKSGGEIMKGVLVVKTKDFLTPHYIRVVLTGEDILNFELAKVGDNNKIVFPSGQAGLTTMGGKPEGDVRTYTLRALDLESKEMTIDFVAHGDQGPASKWATSAQPGDQLIVFMKNKNKQIFKPADWTLLIGDHTALPVISVILEQLPKDAIGKAILEVYAEQDILNLEKPEGVQIEWLYNDKPGEEVLLPAKFDQVEIPATGSKFIFSAAEYQSVRQIQEAIRSNPAIDREEWQSFSYWKFGMAESESGTKRKELTHR